MDEKNDKKPYLADAAGNPLNNSSKTSPVGSPAQLLSPDRYEFYTFDDDGQLVRKIMSINEIKRLIANSEQGSSTETTLVFPFSYYHKVSSLPAIESTQPLGKINPHEPLFSVHDVIASVQNVLKSEIRNKQSQSRPTNNTFQAPVPPTNWNVILPPLFDDSDQQTIKVSPVIEGTTSQESTPAAADVSSVKQTTTIKTTTNPPVTKSSVQSKDPTVKITTYRPKPPTATTVSNVENSTPGGITPSVKNTSPKPGPGLVDHLEADSSKPIHFFSHNSSIPALADSQAMSLKGAHPGLINTHSAIKEAPSETTKEPLKNSTEFDTNPPVKESSNAQEYNNDDEFADLSKVQIPMNQDLAESVSSVLSQIASEISMSSVVNFDKELRTTEESSTLPDTDAVTASNEGEKTTFSPELQEDLTTTNLPLSWLKVPDENSTDSYNIISHESQEETTKRPAIILNFKLQNRPRPFQKVTENDILLEEPTTVASNQKRPDEKLNIVSVETNDSIFGSNLEITTLKNNDEISTIEITDSDAKTDNENLTPVPNPLSTTSSINNSTQVPGVLVVHESNVGKIPRPTDNPDEIIKEDLRSAVTTDQTSDESTEESTTLLQNDVTTIESATEISTNKLDEILDGQESSSSTKTKLPPPNLIEVTDKIVTTEKVQNVETENPSTETEINTEKLMERIGIDEDITLDVNIDENRNTNENESGSGDGFSSSNVNEKSENREEPFIIANGNQSTTDKELIEVTTVISEITETAKPENIEFDENLELKSNPVSKISPNSQPVQYSNRPSVQKPLSSTKPQKPVYIKPSKPIVNKHKPLQTPKPVKPTRLPEPLVVAQIQGEKPYDTQALSSPSTLELDQAPKENLGLEASTTNLDEDVAKFVDLCNELAFSLWSSITHNGLSSARSIVMSPFAVTSLLAMVFLGARGPTSGQMNDVLKLDDMVTFNPHLVFRNVTESVVISRNPGVATATFVRELYSDRNKGKLLDFYKERALQFYDGYVEEVNFNIIGDIVRRRTNLLVKRQTWGKVNEFLRSSSLTPRAPLAAFSANIFQTDCSAASTSGRDGEMYFVVLPSSRLRRLVPVPAAVWRSGFLAGYEPSLDATAVALSPDNSVVSTIFVLPGQQGIVAPGDSLARLEQRLLDESYKKGYWSRLLRCLLPRPGLELQLPRISHRSVINVTSSLQRMGLKDLFSAERADLRGLNGLANDLHLSDMLQVNMFSTCGEEAIGTKHHTEIYPASPLQRREKSADNIFSESIESLFAVSDFEDPAISAMPLALRPRQARVPDSGPQARIPESPRLRFDRPFLFFVRHNPTGLILHMGRFNPRLLP